MVKIYLDEFDNNYQEGLNFKYATILGTVIIFVVLFCFQILAYIFIIGLLLWKITKNIIKYIMRNQQTEISPENFGFNFSLKKQILAI